MLCEYVYILHILHFREAYYNIYTTGIQSKSLRFYTHCLRSASGTRRELEEEQNTARWTGQRLWEEWECKCREGGRRQRSCAVTAERSLLEVRKRRTGKKEDWDRETKTNCLKNVTMKPFFISQYKIRYSWKGDDIHNWRSQELSMLRFQLVIESLYVLKLSVIPSTAHNNIYSTHKLTTIDLEGWSTCTNLVTIVTGVGDGIGNIWNVSLFSN